MPETPLSSPQEQPKQNTSVWKKIAPFAIAAAAFGVAVQCNNIFTRKNAEQKETEDAESDRRCRAYHRKFWKETKAWHEGLPEKDRKDEVVMQYASNAVNAGDTDEAVAFTTQYIDDHAGDPETPKKKHLTAWALKIRARAHFAKGDTAQAIADMELSVATYGKLAGDHYMLAYYLKCAGNTERARHFIALGSAIIPLEEFIDQQTHEDKWNSAPPVPKAVEEYDDQNECEFGLYWSMKRERETWTKIGQALSK